MSVRVVARIRPLLKTELDKDSIVQAVAPLAAAQDADATPTVVKIPNPKNPAENYSFQFNSVYDESATQQQVFDQEIAPTVKHLFAGFDITIFAYGVTGTGKTHTMRGGKTLAERGVIPRLLSSIYRRGRKIEKDSEGTTMVEVSMSYYEIYNDRVYDLFEAPEKRTPAGLPIREHNGKTIVWGLSENSISTLKEFENLYDLANVNRSTSATKLNAHSSRSHAVLTVKVTQTSQDRVIVSTASAIDLAGSEDNRRTDNDKERLVESSSINKSLFVLAQCVEAISKKQNRVPYRESKMTRILSLGQNQGLTVMILNLAPVKSYHLDTLSSLNFANRTKKIEVREVENEPKFKGPPKQAGQVVGPTIQRQPLRPLQAVPVTVANMGVKSTASYKDKSIKSFPVIPEKSKVARPLIPAKDDVLKRNLEAMQPSIPRLNKTFKTLIQASQSTNNEPEISRANLEELVNRMVEEKLASRLLNEVATAAGPDLSVAVQRRLEALEQRVEKQEDGRAEGLQYMLMGKQHQLRGEDASALKMYQLALPFFPENGKLARSIVTLQEKLRTKHTEAPAIRRSAPVFPRKETHFLKSVGEFETDEDMEAAVNHESDGDYQNQGDGESDVDELVVTPKPKRARAMKMAIFRDTRNTELDAPLTPRSKRLLHVINTRDLTQIRTLKGVGPKKAEAIVNSLCSMDESEDAVLITNLEQLGQLRGVGFKTVEVARSAMQV